jgi:hypothetical protein
MAKDTYGRSILPDIPDFYVDRMRLTVTVFGVNITFGLGNPHPEEGNPEDVLDVMENVRLRMSLEHAKLMAILLRKQIKSYEEKNESIVALPKSILEALKLTDNDW